MFAAFGGTSSPSRYVGLPDEEDDSNFDERFGALKAETQLDKAFLENLGKVALNQDALSER